MPIHDDVIPGSDGQPAGQGQLDGGYIPNERHDEPTMTIPVYAKFMGNGLLRFSLHPIYAIHLGNIVGPAGTTPHPDASPPCIAIPGREGPMELAHAILHSAALNEDGLSWEGPTK